MKEVKKEENKAKFNKVVNWIIAGVVFLICISLVGNIQNITGSHSKIVDAKVRLEKLKRENEDLQKRITSIQGVEFVEKTARNKLGLAKAGEIVVVLPDEATIRQFAPVHEEEESFIPDPNWKKWMNIFL